MSVEGMKMEMRKKYEKKGEMFSEGKFVKVELLKMTSISLWTQPWIVCSSGWQTRY